MAGVCIGGSRAVTRVVVRCVGMRFIIVKWGGKGVVGRWRGGEWEVVGLLERLEA